MPREPRQPAETAQPAPALAPNTVTKAVKRAAERLELSNRVLAGVLGLSEATVSRMGAGSYQLDAGSKPFELAVLFLRLFRSLDGIAGGDTTVARSWLRNDNTALGAKPIAMIESVAGLVNVVAYLDARRALG
ncbi:MAG: MbcA/ParS/Xre antitoxin family protein [Cyanobacteria bacterium]|nr:MbcA/ParS/Xre antitoxin family protein [Cyanobacteriota bacterium]